MTDVLEFFLELIQGLDKKGDEVVACHFVSKLLLVVLFDQKAAARVDGVN